MNPSYSDNLLALIAAYSKLEKLANSYSEILEDVDNNPLMENYNLGWWEDPTPGNVSKSFGETLKALELHIDKNTQHELAFNQK